MCHTNINDTVFLVKWEDVIIVIVSVFIFCLLIGGIFICYEKRTRNQQRNLDIDNAMRSGIYSKFPQWKEESIPFHLSVDTVDSVNRNKLENV